MYINHENNMFLFFLIKTMKKLRKARKQQKNVKLTVKKRIETYIFVFKNKQKSIKQTK